MKSGTNWLGSLLNSHEEISCIGEFHWQQIVANFNANQNNLPIYESDKAKSLARGHLEKMIRQCMLDQADPNASLIGDRTPHSIMPVTLQGVPNISIIRDGRDILVSRAFHLYNHPDVHRLFDRIPEMKDTFESFKADQWYFQKEPEQLLKHEVMVRESLRWWRQHLEQDESVAQQYPNLPVRFVRYEDLHRDTASERAKLFEFLNVDPSRSAKITGILKPGFKEERPAQFLRKGSVGDWKNYFTEETKQWFKEEAGESLIKYDYESSYDW
ncbi:MAG: sulfotransferase domain-containing protein [Mariniblastus sp.]|nr:sulfotransferase domain-containing protein [Mariniblastus sp.]